MKKIIRKILSMFFMIEDNETFPRFFLREEGETFPTFFYREDTFPKKDI